MTPLPAGALLPPASSPRGPPGLSLPLRNTNAGVQLYAVREDAGALEIDLQVGVGARGGGVGRGRGSMLWRRFFRPVLRMGGGVLGRWCPSLSPPTPYHTRTHALSPPTQVSLGDVVACTVSPIFLRPGELRLRGCAPSLDGLALFAEPRRLGRDLELQAATVTGPRGGSCEGGGERGGGGGNLSKLCASGGPPASSFPGCLLLGSQPPCTAWGVGCASAAAPRRWRRGEGSSR